MYGGDNTTQGYGKIKEHVHGFARWSGVLLTSIIGAAIGGYAIVQVEEKERTGREMRETEREISRSHAEYSKCMADIIEFDQSMDNAPAAFKEEMNKPKRTEVIKRVNDCRSITKEFWRSVMFYDEAFRAFETESEKKALFRGRYSRFAPVVRKYDNLKGYSGTDPVFEIKTFGDVYPEEESM